jgi:hypothetical protein
MQMSKCVVIASSTRPLVPTVHVEDLHLQLQYGIVAIAIAISIL